MSVVLAAEHLTKTFVSQGRENYTAVDDVSFSVESGEKLGIIGESGSGKTTVVNMITRLLDVSSGTIRLDGEDITLKKGKDIPCSPLDICHRTANGPDTASHSAWYR